MTKASLPTENLNKQSYNTKMPSKSYDYTTIGDRTISCSSDSNGCSETLYGIPTFQLIAKSVQNKGHAFKNLLIILLIENEDQQPTQAERS